jgi:hypothetical protein
MSGIKLKPVAEVEQEVMVDVPRGKGKFASKKMLVTYKLLPASELREFFELPEDERMEDDDLMRRDVTAVNKVTDVIDIDGDLETVETPDLVAALMDVPYIRSALIKSWWDTQSNRHEHAEKN